MKQENPGFNAEGRRGGEREASDESPVLLRLQERFERFRRGTVRWTRVPADLRAAVLEAVRQGVTLTEVRRACGLSLSQLRLWGAAEVSERCTLPGKSTGLGDRVRVFSVVDSGPAAGEVSAVASRGGVRNGCDEALELRLGPWLVRVGLAGSSSEAEGG